MSKKKILYVCQEVVPYLQEGVISERARMLAQGMQERGGEIRTFMPRYGVVNERRNQLHEVIRLSGMNLIIGGNDHQLIIKVASIPAVRVQIYFIDNDDYFHRKATLRDPETGKFFEDNDERAIFFARGVLETVKKLRWAPDVLHCHGWISCVAPVLMREVFGDDPIFRDNKIVISLYDEDFPFPKMDPAYENLAKRVIDLADGVVVEQPLRDRTLVDYALQRGKNVLENYGGDQYLDEYQKFYDEIL